MKIKVKATNVYQRNREAKKRLVINEGSTGSSKSYSLAQLFITRALEEPDTYSICRKSLPTLKATAYRDFINILKQWNLYDQNSHNRTEHIYKLGKSQIEFFALDDPQKVRSRRRGYMWMNEANEFTLEDYRQLSMRTNKQVFLDYNPSAVHSWIYELMEQEDHDFIHSTYQDNPFLPEDIVKEIESYKSKDKNYYRVYALGLRATSEKLIFTHWKMVDSLPEGDEFYGLDFGYNHPTVLTRNVLKDDDLYSKEVFYRRYLMTPDIIALLKEHVPKNAYIYGDSEDPEKIEQIRQAGFNIKPMTKGAGSVKAGIDLIKSRGLYITKDSANGLKELKSYQWKEKEGKPIDEPVKAMDDFCDSMRGAVFSHLKQPEADFAFV